MKTGAIDAPLHADGQVQWQNEPVHFSIETATVGSLMADLSEIPVKGRVTGLGGTLDVNGRVLGSTVDAQITLAVTDLRFLKSQIGPTFGGAGPIQVTGHVRGGAANAALENVVVRVGSSDAAGGFTLAQTGGRYKVAGTLRSQRLDLQDFGMQQAQGHFATGRIRIGQTIAGGLQPFSGGQIFSDFAGQHLLNSGIGGQGNQAPKQFAGRSLVSLGSAVSLTD